MVFYELNLCKHQNIFSQESILSLVIKASRGVANLTERKNLHTHFFVVVVGVYSLSIEH